MANVPQNTWTKARQSVPEVSKKFEFLAHKTVSESKNSKNNEILNSSTSETSTPQTYYIGKKREFKGKYNEEKKLNKDSTSKKILYCLNCAWKFPERMSILRRNSHINMCYEGNGPLDIMKYNEEQKLKLYRNYPNKKIMDLMICPICGKDIHSANNKAKQNHLHCCSKLSLIK